MKTGISVPDELFELASRRASELGLSRSEFFARAARLYLDELDDRSLTGRIDDALERLDPPDVASAEAVAAGQRLLGGVDAE